MVKAGAASGWQARGFASDEAIKIFHLICSAGPAAHAYQNRVATPGNIAEMDPRFVERFRRPGQRADPGLAARSQRQSRSAALCRRRRQRRRSDASALELLVLATSAWLEVTSLRKQAAKSIRKRLADSSCGGSDAASARSNRVFVFRSLRIARAQACSSSVSEPQPAASEPAQQEAAAEVVEVAARAAAAMAMAAAPAAATDPLAGLSPEDADIHRKAQRFARLLVDEIKLYNQAKVAEGRRHKDFYDRLKEDIEKSRGTFQKRYGKHGSRQRRLFSARVAAQPGRR